VAGAAAAGRGKAAMSEINVTPMVDVMLVLLIIFMVAAPLLTVGVPLELPKTAAQAGADRQEEPLTITITADGALAMHRPPKLRMRSCCRSWRRLRQGADLAQGLPAGGRVGVL
jgi:biopolymer transport protein ExbD